VVFVVVMFDLSVFYCILLTVVCVDRALFVGICLVNDSLKFIELKSIYIFCIHLINTH